MDIQPRQSAYPHFPLRPPQFSCLKAGHGHGPRRPAGPIPQRMPDDEAGGPAKMIEGTIEPISVEVQRGLLLDSPSRSHTSDARRPWR